MSVIDWTGDLSLAPAYEQSIPIFHTVLIAGGWVQANDTGQLASDGSTGATGYLVYKMNDALQNTSPVFVKFWWAGFGSVAVQIGTGSNGAGKITGVVYPTRRLHHRPEFYFADSSSNFNSRIIGSAGPARVCMAYFQETGIQPPAYYFAIERTKNETGEDTGEGLIVSTVVGPYSRYDQSAPTTTNARHSLLIFSDGAMVSPMSMCSSIPPPFTNDFFGGVSNIEENSCLGAVLYPRNWKTLNVGNYGLNSIVFVKGEAPDSIIMSIYGTNRRFRKSNVCGLGMPPMPGLYWFDESAAALSEAQQSSGQPYGFYPSMDGTMLMMLYE